jgi:hypothetical protein
MTGFSVFRTNVPQANYQILYHIVSCLLLRFFAKAKQTKNTPHIKKKKRIDASRRVVRQSAMFVL